MVNYNNGKIYKIESICEHEEGEVYIGSTSKEYLSQRMEYHKRDYNNYKKGLTSKTMTSFKLYDKYGIDNCRIILIELVDADSKEELLMREAYYIRNIKCVNKMIPLRTKQEYRNENKEKIHKYYLDNIERFSEKINCECGSIYRRDHKARHFKTIKHCQYILNQN